MNLSLIITTFNRPNYLARCFDSLRYASFPEGTTIIIVDDASTDPTTIELIHQFATSPPENTTCLIHFKRANKGIKDSLLIGYDIAFKLDSWFVINLDADALVRKDFVERLLHLKKNIPGNIVSGFNTTVENRNPIIVETKTYFFKKYASGINMCVSEHEYRAYILPALKQPGNWDYNASLEHEKDGGKVIVTKPSVVAHIGTQSAMGHGVSEKPDMAVDFYFHDLPDVTLIGATGSDLPGLQKAFDISTKYIKFGAVKILSHLPSNDERVVPISPLRSKAEYNVFTLKKMVDYVDTDYFMVIQSDGYVVNPASWSDDFLKFDYVGAPWNFSHPPYPGYHVGNGGMSIRSKRLHEILRDDENIRPVNDVYIKNYEEDHLLAKVYRKYLEEQYDIKFAPVEVAERFSVENYGVRPPHNKYKGSLGFHGYGNIDWTGVNYLEHIPSK
jgi:glycosyltransferase involved in cell wall biosynthesis